DVHSQRIVQKGGRSTGRAEPGCGGHVGTTTGTLDGLHGRLPYEFLPERQKLTPTRDEGLGSKEKSSAHPVSLPASARAKSVYNMNLGRASMPAIGIPIALVDIFSHPVVHDPLR